MGMLTRPSSSGDHEGIPYKKEACLSGGISPSGRQHSCSAANRASCDVRLPDSLDQLCHGHPCKPLLEALVPLEGEDKLEVLGLGAVIQEAVVAYLLKAGGEHMQEEPPDKLAFAYGNSAFFIPRLQPPCGKRDLGFRDGEDTAVGNGDLMCVPAQIFDGVTEAIKGLLDVRAPVFTVKGIFKSLPSRKRYKVLGGIRNDDLAILPEGIQEGEVLPFELVPQDKDRDKKLSTACADPSIRSESASGDNAVHVDMVEHLLVPGMENLDDARLCAEVLFVGGEFQEGFGTALVQEAVKELLVGKKERGEFMGQGKDHMKIR